MDRRGRRSLRIRANKAPPCHPERNEVESNPEGVCEAQDLRGDSKILLIDPASRPP